ncbi:MAG: DUF5309 domain-containing protein [Lachnospiraceae bacterium]|nr:DUF5309 domain-containing protein [Ruminococcus sp.]MCM1277055.1 DUF5309 domain-containing protein [Lachnospiraceae bacterium]
MPDNTIAMSFSCPNYSGTLYTKSNVETPFLNAIGGALHSNTVEFVTSQDYSLEEPSQPSISEADSAKPAAASFITRKQETNVTQIFREAVSVTHAKLANMGTLSGINIAGQQPNPIDELQFQKAAKMKKIANDIEYTFINGKFNKATSDSEANKTRGIIEAITTNAVMNAGAVDASTLRSTLNTFFKTMFDNGASPDGNTVFVNSMIAAAITAAYTDKMQLYPNGTTSAGAAIRGLMTDFGTVNIILARTVPQNTLLCVKTQACHPVEQTTPGYGNFYYMDKSAGEGAAFKGEIFGQIGLDYGAEYLHGKLVFTE